MRINKIPPARGFAWYSEAFSLYKKNPIKLSLILTAINLLPLLLTKLFPFVGIILGNFIFTLLLIGFFSLCAQLKSSNQFAIDPLFKSLLDFDLCLSVLWLTLITFFMFFLSVGLIVFFNVLLGIGEKDIMSLIQIINSGTLYLIPDSFLRILAIDCLLLIVFAMLIGASVIFAPLLMAFKEMSALSAMKSSLLGNLKNIVPFFWMSIGAIPLIIFTVITIGVGLLVTLPIFTIAIYLAYEDLFNG